MKKKIAFVALVAAVLGVILSLVVIGANKDEAPFAGYQYKANGRTSYSCRLIGLCESEIEGEKGFLVSLRYENAVDGADVIRSDLKADKLYDSVIATENGVEHKRTASDIARMKGIELSSPRIFLGVIDVPFFAGKVSVSVTPYVTVSGVKRYSDSFSFYMNGLPELDLGGANDEYSLNYGCSLSRHFRAKRSDFERYAEELSAAGYNMRSESEKNGNLFATYTDVLGFNAAHVSFYAEKGYLQIVYGKSGYISEPLSGYSSVLEPSIVQHGAITPSIYSGGYGMCYIVQLANGEFAIFDSGNFNGSEASKKDVEGLWTQIKALHDENPDPNKPEKPQITWFITHSHPDHVSGLNQFLYTPSLTSKVNIKMFCYNFPDFTTTRAINDQSNNAQRIENFMARAKSAYPDAVHFEMHTGQSLYLAGCEIETLYTYEDYLHEYPDENNYTFRWINYTSSVWKLSFTDGKCAGRSILITGDIEHAVTDNLVSNYGAYLKSDILQVIHHGYSGGSNAFSNIFTSNSESRVIALWSCPGTVTAGFFDRNRTGADSSRAFNKILRNASSVRNFHAGVTVRVDIATLKTYLNGVLAMKDHDGDLM